MFIRNITGDRFASATCRIILALLILSIASPKAVAQLYQPAWTSLDKRPAPAWFADAKFGIFIHWGVYSVPAYRPLENGLYASYAEWYYAKVYHNEANGGKAFHEKNFGKEFEYRDFAPLFKAELWNPGNWASLFKNAGARYVVLTAKHHDGFCLWPTKSPYKKAWNALDTGPQRDLVGELADAVRKQGMRMGLYYSIPEWESSKTHRTPTGYYVPLHLVEKYKIPEEDYVEKHLLPQLKELVTNYRPSLLFSDGGEWDGTEEYYRTKEFLAWLYNESPVKNEIVVNDRFAKDMPGKHGDYFSSEYGDANLRGGHLWEESRGIGGSYGYNRAEDLEHYSTSKQLILELIDIVSRGGNLLLNVGPTADGRIPVIMQQRLQDIGAWLRVNGEGIFESRKHLVPSEQTKQGKLYYTRKGAMLYVFFSQWPQAPLELTLPPSATVSGVSLLGLNKKTAWKQKGGKLVVTVPDCNIDKLPSVHAWTLKVKMK
jgi:alpha-L-fucosidase